MKSFEFWGVPCAPLLEHRLPISACTTFRGGIMNNLSHLRLASVALALGLALTAGGTARGQSSLSGSVDAANATTNSDCSWISTEPGSRADQPSDSRGAQGCPTQSAGSLGGAAGPRPSVSPRSPGERGTGQTTGGTSGTTGTTGITGTGTTGIGAGVGSDTAPGTATGAGVGSDRSPTTRGTGAGVGSDRSSVGTGTGTGGGTGSGGATGAGGAGGGAGGGGR